MPASIEWAIGVLNAVQEKSDPGVLNYLGYAHRKAGMIETGIAYYQQALAIDPDYVLAREYLGEGYVAAGNVELARQQLQEIGTRCGTNCEEYLELAEVIASAQVLVPFLPRATARLLIDEIATEEQWR